MNEILREKIIIVLTEYLNREPTEKEVNNAVTDINIMFRVAQL